MYGLDGREKKTLEILNQCHAVITNSHVVYASGKHGSAYVNKDALYAYPELVAELCGDIVTHFYNEDRSGINNYEVVIGPEKGGIILAQWVGYNSVFDDRHEGNTIKAVYAEKEVEVIYRNDSAEAITAYLQINNTVPKFAIQPGETLFRETGKFVIKRGYDKLVTGKKVLVVEDVLNTGGSVEKVVKAVRAIGGKVVAVAALCNRGGVTAADIGDVPELFSLVNITLEMWESNECPLCAKKVPINTSVGKGEQFLARQGK